MAELARGLTTAWGCWSPTLTGDGRRVAYVSDRRGVPELWIQPVGRAGAPRVVPLSADPVLEVRWSPDGAWLACSVATGGGVRAEVWVVRPDGTGASRLAGGEEHVILGPWTRRGHRIVMTCCGNGGRRSTRAALVDPDRGGVEHIAAGGLVQVLDLSADGRFALLRDGTRGAQYCRLLDRWRHVDHAVLPFDGSGSTSVGLLRPSPPGDPVPLVAYVVTDADRPLRALVGAAFGRDGARRAVGTLAERGDAELEFVDADAAGRRLLLVWNCGGHSEVELLDTTDGVRRPVGGLPGTVVSGGVVAGDGSCAVLSVESPRSPRRLWSLDLDGSRWDPLTPDPLERLGSWRHAHPVLHHFESHDGLPISGWLYRPTTATATAAGSPADRTPPVDPAGPAPAVVSLHGGPEGQERPTFSPEHQVLVAAGLVVFAPNIRGSSGAGRVFEHADDRFGRLNAIDDVAACTDYLCSLGVADARRIGLAGRSYGGYATLMALTRYPERFVAGIDICGMSDLRTFYRTTEPWIARAAVTKYGDPGRDDELLANLSPLRHVDRLTVPLLVVHGALDTNVPVAEAHQLVDALRARDRPVRYLELDGEGHEYRRATSRLRILEGIVDFLAATLGRVPASGVGGPPR